MNSNTRSRHQFSGINITGTSKRSGTYVTHQ